MLLVMSVFGTRPEAIKMAPLVKELQRDQNIQSIVCVTSQHKHMLNQVLAQFQIQPDHNLNIMEPSQTLASITSKVTEGMSQLIKNIKPDLVLVHGDTTTSFAGALAAFYNKVPVGHVEAGLRSFDKYSPFPEEMNRMLTSQIAQLHFAPTQANRENLRKEHVEENVFVTGNTVIDALKQMITPNHVFENDLLNKLCYGGTNSRLVLLTAHRRENLGTPLENICKAVKRLVLENDDIQVIYPLHLNPAVREGVSPHLSGLERVHLIEPIAVQDMHNLLQHCYMVMTDSGGLQEEAPALGIPVIVLRTTTERPEICNAGMGVLAGIEEQSIYHHASLMLNEKSVYGKMRNADNPYGDGNASERITQAICYWAGLTGQKPSDFAP